MKSFVVALAFVALGSLPLLAQELPDGWVLEESPKTVTNYLIHYDLANRDVDIGITCNPGFADVVFAFYSDLTDKPEQAKLELLLSNDDATFPIDATGYTFDDHYLIEGIVAFEEPLNGLLRSAFTVSVDGEELGQFSAESGPDAINKTIEACREP